MLLIVAHDVQLHRLGDWSIRFQYLLFLGLNLNCYQLQMPPPLGQTTFGTTLENVNT